MRKRLVVRCNAGAVAVAGVGIGAVTANTSGLDTWMSGMNHNRIIQVQNEGGVQSRQRQGRNRLLLQFVVPDHLAQGDSDHGRPVAQRPVGRLGICGTGWTFPRRRSISACRPMRISTTMRWGRLEANMLLDRMAGTFPAGRRHHYRHCGQAPVRRSRHRAPGPMR